MTTSDTPRVFISYRTSDGVDKATALARELNAVFGEAQVFLDKEDLPAGRLWREAIGATLGDKPVLLPGVGGDPIETGRLSVEADAARITMAGLLWLNGEQAQRNVQLMRRR